MRVDQAIAFKALAAEVQEAGYHFWILHHLVRSLQRRGLSSPLHRI